MGSVGVKIISAGMMFLMFLLAARVLDESTFGELTILFSLASMIAVFAAFGQEMLIMRLWNEYGAKKHFGLLKGAIIFGAGICVLLGLLSSIGFGLYLYKNDHKDLALAAAVFIFFYTLILFFSHFCRAVAGVIIADGHRDITQPLLLNLYLFTCFILSFQTTLETIFWLLTLGCLVALGFQLYAIYHHIKESPFSSYKTKAAFDLKAWMPPSLKLWFVTLLETSNQYLEVVLIGILLNPMAAGIYFVATRLANAFSTAADAFNMFGSKHIPDLYYNERHIDLASLLKTMALMTLLVIGAGLFIFSIGGTFILGLFNETYKDYYWVLIILSLGTVCLAAAGPATQMLMLTGHEGRYLTIMTTSVGVRILGFYLLIPEFEIYGAAFANALSLVLIAVFVTLSSRMHTGHDPSILRLSGTPHIPKQKQVEM